jgi:hypothetical protein
MAAWRLKGKKDAWDHACLGKAAVVRPWRLVCLWWTGRGGLMAAPAGVRRLGLEPLLWRCGRVERGLWAGSLTSLLGTPRRSLATASAGGGCGNRRLVQPWRGACRLLCTRFVDASLRHQGKGSLPMTSPHSTRCANVSISTIRDRAYGVWKIPEGWREFGQKQSDVPEG